MRRHHALRHKALGALVRARRLERGMTQRELAQLLGLNADWLSRLENGALALDLFDWREFSAAVGITWKDIDAISDDPRYAKLTRGTAPAGRRNRRPGSPR